MRLSLKRDIDLAREASIRDDLEKMDCGEYQRDEIIEAKLCECKSMNEFSFRTNPLSADDYILIRQAIQAKYPSGALRYEARPYTTNINDLKLVKLRGNPTDRVYRCRITDMHTFAVRSKIQIRVDLYLVDAGRSMQDIPLNNIFDFPQSVSALKEPSDGVKRAKLKLGFPFDQENFCDDEISRYFVDRLSKGTQEIKVKILGFKEGKYYVDILDSSERAIVQHLKEMFKTKFDQVTNRLNNLESTARRKSRKELVRESALLKRLTQPSNDTCFADGFTDPSQSNSNRAHMRNKLHKYHSSLHYFRDKLAAARWNSRQSVVSKMSKYLVKVKIVTWTDPDEFYVVPADVDYYANHDYFFTSLENYQDKHEADNKDIDHGLQHYQVDQFCLCRNERDIKIGRWLRGKVLEVRGSLKSGFINQDGRIREKLNGPGIDESARGVFYKVLLIDYGLCCVRKAVNMRQVTNEMKFQLYGTWALRCRLFGLKPLRDTAGQQEEESKSTPKEYSLKCNQLMGAWLREKMVAKSGATFSLMFHDCLKSQNDMNPRVAVSLFYCFQPYAMSNDLLIPHKKRVRYQCLNSALIEQGLVCNEDTYSNEPSFVELDEYVLNKLVPLGMIDI